jgi:SAM-dependent methyltransferase
LALVKPKPRGWSERYGAVFAGRDVVDHYHLRPPYPAETLDVLAGFADRGAALDLGCGTGELARRLAPRIGRVEAIDVSEAMIDRGRRLPGGDAPNLRWHVDRVEDVTLGGPYALAVAGDSIHWFDWQAVFPLLADALGEEGVLAVVRRDWLRDERLRKQLAPVYGRHSWNEDFASLDPVAELERRGLFTRLGLHESAAEPWRPTLDELVGVHYSASGFAPSRLADPDRFEAEVREAVEATLEPREGRYDLDVVATVVWGKPRSTG